MRAALLAALAATVAGCTCAGRGTRADASDSGAQRAEADAARQFYWAKQAMERQAGRRPAGRVLYFVWEDSGVAPDGRRLAPEVIGVPVYVPYPMTSSDSER